MRSIIQSHLGPSLTVTLVGLWAGCIPFLSLSFLLSKMKAVAKI